VRLRRAVTQRWQKHRRVRTANNLALRLRLRELGAPHLVRALLGFSSSEIMKKLAITVALCLCAISAAARDGDVRRGGANHAWMEEQHNVRGDWCCDISDGHLLEDNEWRQSDDLHYQVLIKDVWITVPDYALRDPKGGPNPTGKAIVWYTDGDGIHIYCFAPGWQA
jgi:hypothetical protein